MVNQQLKNPRRKYNILKFSKASIFSVTKIFCLKILVFLKISTFLQNNIISAEACQGTIVYLIH
jgi:hypothetical protein